LVVTAHRINTKGHGAKATCGVSDEAESIQLVLDPHVCLIIARGRCCVVGVVVEVTKGGEEGTQLKLGLLEVPLLESLLVKDSLALVLAKGILLLALAATRVVAAVVEASILQPARPPVLAIAGKLREPTGHKCQLLILETLHLLLCNGQ
jgi:hypothetical protein